MTFNVRGANPGGVGGYTGNVTLTKLGKSSGTVRWVTGPKREVTEGVAIKTEGVFGTAYGGKGLYALAVYELKGKSIKGTWTMANKPEESDVYELKGSDFEGSLTFSDGTAGSITFTPTQGGIYKVAWDLASGHYEGIGLRLGNSLVAASGDLKVGFGVGIYAPKGDNVEGLWATTKMEAPGAEIWTLPSGDDAPAPKLGQAGDGTAVKFGGETYELKENKSAPGQVTSELREYLRKGEEWETYSKMVAFRMQHVKVDAAGLARATLDQVQKEHPNSYVKEVNMEADTATIFFILVKEPDAEMNIFRYQRTEAGIASAQFVMRNKPPYESQKKFKAEQDKMWDKWLAELDKLGESASAIIAATAGQGVPDSAPMPKKGSEDEHLAKAISADMDKCVSIAKQFMGALQAGETAKAVGLMSDRAFGTVSRKDFLEIVEKSNAAYGMLKDYKPDRGATDFGVKNGVMTFTLQADAEYEKGKVRETLKFIRNDQGDIEFVEYDRAPKI